MSKLSRIARELVTQLSQVEVEIDNLQEENRQLKMRIDILNNALLFSMSKLDMNIEEMLNAYSLAKDSIEPFADAEILPTFEEMQELKTTLGLTDKQMNHYYESN